MKLITSITITEEVTAGLGIVLGYSEVTLPENVVVEKVLLERYVIPKQSVYMGGLKQAIEEQTVLQHLGAETAVISKLFSMGGGDVQVEGKFIDITKAWTNNYPLIVDSEIDIDNFIYLYRVSSYGKPDYELATRYVTGVLRVPGPITNEKIREYEYVKFLDNEDLLGIFPDNLAGFVKWINSQSLFHETYRLRPRGEIESFKFSSYYQRAFIIKTLIEYMGNKNEEYVELLESGVNGIYT